jgi:hypothetical protein
MKRSILYTGNIRAVKKKNSFEQCRIFFICYLWGLFLFHGRSFWWALLPEYER